MSSSDASAADAGVEEACRLATEDPEALLALVGPTASGKTSLAIRLGERLGGEVISADSVQIYRGFDVGSGKPTPSERARVPHHLVGVLDPFEPADAARYAVLAGKAIEEVRSRGRRPIVCGGTFLWIKALWYGLAPAPPADEAVRARHREQAERMGRASLHQDLSRLDPESARRLHPNDLVRVSRALEVHELTGRPMSEWQAEHGFATARERLRLLGPRCDRKEHDARIEARVRRWLAEGWVEEVRGLVAKGYGDARAMGSVGYKQVREHLAGRIPESELSGAIVRATRVYVRRQRTWLRRAEVAWVG